MVSTSMPVRDAAGNLRDMAQEQDPETGIRTPRYAPEVAGAAVSGANPLPTADGVAGVALGAPADAEAAADGSVIGLLKRLRTLLGGVLTVRQKGGTGTSYSQNLPADLATLGTLLLTIPANASRGHAFVENQSGSDLVLVGDDGTGGQVWMRILTGVGAGQQGADWTSDTFLGRVRVYGAAGARVSAAEV